MEDYLRLKQQYSDCVLLYRIGEFYEAMADDALLVSKKLGLTLAKNQKHIPLCGVPAKSLNTYVKRLICQNLKVAVAEERLKQDENGKKQLSREISRVYTCGTLTEDELTDDEGDARFLLAILHGFADIVTFAWVDLCSNELFIAKGNNQNINDYLVKIDPCEIIIRSCDQPYLQDSSEYAAKLSIYDPEDSILVPDVEIWQQYFDSDTQPVGDDYLAVLQYLLTYLSYTNRQVKFRLSKPKLYDEQRFMRLDSNTLKQLGCVATAGMNAKYTLLKVLDKTCSASGKRLLRQLLTHPLTDRVAINKRLDAVAYLSQNPQFLLQIRTIITDIGDLERFNNKIYQEKANIFDLLHMKNSLRALDKLSSIFNQLLDEIPIMLKDIFTGTLGEYQHLTIMLEEALNDEEICMGNAAEKGIRLDYNPVLAVHMQKLAELQERLPELEENYAQQLHISNLKIKQNKVIGYFIEIPPSSFAKLDNQPEFVLKQRSNSFVRFTTEELRELENSLNLTSNQIELTKEGTIQELITQGIEYYDEITRAAKRVALLDVLSTFAFAAQENHYVRPVVDDSDAFSIKQGRHPIVEAYLADSGCFVSNDCDFDAQHCCKIITGSNMAGKSTYLRQVALLCLMAQAGSFVPATAMHLGVLDRIFTRIGADDNIANGQSTFMVEMLDTARILQNATQHSLVIIDELGRGTAYNDGIAIAEAVLQYLTADRSKAPFILFATHYHSLAQQPHPHCLSYHFPLIQNSLNKLVFSHQLTLGTADNSYGIEIAKLAGFPEEVTQLAQQLLNQQKS